MDYCQYVNSLGDSNPEHKDYHDNCYGYPIKDDNELFGRLILEINQAGLSWTTILKKASNFREAYSNFNIDLIAEYNDQDRQRLITNVGIIRNKLKIEAVIYNAKQVRIIQNEFRSFRNWLDINSISIKTKEEWIKLFKKHFKFTGGEIVNEFLLSTGYLKGAHSEQCPIYQKVLKQNPIWNQK